MKRKIAAVGLSLAAMLTLAGCSATGVGWNAVERDVKLNNGKTVTCLVAKGTDGLAITCDWAGEK